MATTSTSGKEAWEIRVITLVISVELDGCYFKFNKPFNQDERP